MQTLDERYTEQIAGQLECLDRVVITGTLPGLCYAGGMTSYLYQQKIRIFDYPQFVQPLREQIRNNAERLAKASGLEIEFIRKKNFRKSDRIKTIIEARGEHTGLVHIFSAMEPCTAYKPWHDKKSHKTFLKPDSGKCLHYYFYFIDPMVGLCYLRVPTWCPFRLQFYFNGHNYLANQLTRKGIGYEMIDNAFVHIDDWETAQQLANQFNIKRFHRLLDKYATLYCPACQTLAVPYYWSLMQVEFASDIVFHRARELQPLYETLSRSAIHLVKPDHVATFLGRKLDPRFLGERGNHYHTRVEGTRIKHHMANKAAIKLYDKFGRILRIETTPNDVGFFKHYRKVEHRDGTVSKKQAPLRKTIYSLPVLITLSRAANRRYLEFISAIEDPSPGVKKVYKLSSTVRENGRSLRGFNILNKEEHALFIAISRGEFHINGMTNKDLRKILPNKSSAQMSRLLKRLRAHGLIKKIGRTYKYYITKFGHSCLLCAIKLRDWVLIPSLA